MWLSSPKFSVVMRAGVVAAMIIGAGACGRDKKSKDEVPATESNECSYSAAGQGCVVKSTGDTVTMDFSSAVVGQQYIVAPFVLGNVNKIAGSLRPHNFTFNVRTAGGTALQLRRNSADVEGGDKDGWQSKFAMDHDKRSLANRFDPSKGIDQGEWFWQLARHLDGERPEARNLVGSDRPSVEGFYRQLAKNPQKNKLKRVLDLVDSGCPTATLKVPKADGANTLSVPVSDSYADPSDKFCVAYVSNPVTVSDKEAIKAAIAKILRVYSGPIYNDSFASKGAYKFRPVFAFVDVSDEDVWDQSAALNLAGAFISYTSVAAGYPVIYIASDFTKVGSFGESSQTSVLRGQFYSVIAHEVQHAILHYYRLNQAGTALSNAEPVSIDEGLAHFMEDLFGYAADGFKFWAVPFLQGYTDATNPFLVGSNDYGDGVSAPLARSASHTLLYYLSSQKGGVTFDANGEPSGGGGLTFVKNVVKSATAIGPANLAANFSGDWWVTMGNYLGALAVDHVDLGATVAKKYTVQEPSNVVTNLTSTAAQSYGMRFNNYLELATHPNSDYGNPKNTPAVPNQMSYYMTAPLLYTITNPAEKLSFQCDCGGETENIAASVVRIK